MLFRRGYTYHGGFDKPFVLSEARIRSELVDAGFEVLVLWPCEGCAPDWDWVGIVRRVGPTADLEVPSRVKWVTEYPPLQPTQEPRMIHGPFPLSPFEDCEDAVTRCGAMGWTLSDCAPASATGQVTGTYTCSGEPIGPPALPGPRTQERKKPPFPWGIAVVGALLAGVTVYAIYTDPMR